MPILPANGANNLFLHSIWLSKWVTVVFPLVPVIPIQFASFKLAHAIFTSPITLTPFCFSLSIVWWSLGMDGLITTDSISFNHGWISSNTNSWLIETNISSFSSSFFLSKISLLSLLSQTITLLFMLLKNLAAQNPDYPNPITKLVFLGLLK